jgi:succinyl-CoA synthetase beta subunit
MERFRLLSEVLDFLSKNKVNIAQYLCIEDMKDLSKIKYPAYLKIDSLDHKKKLGGVKYCENRKDCLDNVLVFIKKFPKNLLVLQEEKKGYEMFVGVKSDRVFGKVLVIGEGGTLVEKKRNVAFRPLPASKKDIKEMIQELKIELPEKTKKDKFVGICQRISKISKDFSEIDLNPVILNRKGAFVVDARIF